MPFCGASERCSFSSTLKIYYLLLIRNHRMRFGLALLLASSPLATVVIDFSSYWFGGMRTDQLIHFVEVQSCLPNLLYLCRRNLFCAVRVADIASESRHQPRTRTITAQEIGNMILFHVRTPTHSFSQQHKTATSTFMLSFFQKFEAIFVFWNCINIFVLIQLQQLASQQWWIHLPCSSQSSNSATMMTSQPCSLSGWSCTSKQRSSNAQGWTGRIKLP